jgi:hypothetical protein
MMSINPMRNWPVFCALLGIAIGLLVAHFM